MAEYYPLLAKAIAGLPHSTPETRRAVYDRAHKALLAQLRSIDPPIAERDVARETEALASAVARLETELANVNGHASDRPPAASKIAVPPAPGREPPAKAPPQRQASSSFPPAPRINPPRRDEPGFGRPPGGSASSAQPSAAQPSTAPGRGPALGGANRPGVPQPPSFAPPKPAAPAGHDAPRLREPGLGARPPERAAERPKERPKERPIEPPMERSLERSTDRSLERPTGRPEQRPLTPPPRHQAEAPAYEDEEQDDRAEYPDEGYEEGYEPLPEETEGFGEADRPRAERLRLYPPQPDNEEARSSFRLWVVGGIVGVVVAIVAIAAWTLRDRPDDLAKLKAPVVTDTDKGGKIAQRIDGAANTDAQTSGQATSSDVAPAPAAPMDPNAAPKPADQGQSVPIAYRAAMLVEAPEEQSKVKTFVGTVVWRLDNVSGGAGQPLGTAVHADVDIPGDNLKIGLTLQKNTDPSLPASHTITVDFSVLPGSPTGGVKQINVPQLRQDDAPKGDALIGVPVPIMENSFLVGLSRGTAEATNLQLLKDRAWIDIPILLGNGKIAKLTFEKGAAGTRAINDAVAAWQAQ